MAEQIFYLSTQFIDFQSLTDCLVRIGFVALLLGLSRVQKSDNLESF